MERTERVAAGWQVTLLGRFAVRGPEGVVDLPCGAQRVVAYAVIVGESVARTTVASTIWPDSSGSRARANLRTVLWRLGAIAPILTSTPTAVSLAAHVSTDVDGLAVRSGGRACPMAPADAVLRGFDLELLAGWDDEWVRFERERVRHLELHALDDIVSTSLLAGDTKTAVDAAMRAVRLDPMREASHIGLLRALSESGNRASALAHYRRFARNMRDELGLDPSPGVQEVVAGMLAGSRPAMRVRQA